MIPTTELSPVRDALIEQIDPCPTVPMPDPSIAPAAPTSRTVAAHDAAPHPDDPINPGARQREILRQLRRLIDARSQAFAAANRELRLAARHADEQLTEASESAVRTRDESLRAADATYEEAVKAVADVFEASRAEAKRTVESVRAKLSAELETEERSAARALKEKIWAAETIFEANQNKPEAEYTQTKKQIEKKLNDLVTTESVAGTLLSEYRQPIDPASLAAATQEVEPERSPDPAAEFDRRAEAAARLTASLDRATLPRLVKSGTVYVLAIVFVCGMTALGAWSQQWKFDAIVAAAAGASVIFAATAVWAASRAARARVAKIRRPLILELVGARSAAERWLAHAGSRRDAYARSLADARDAEVLQAKTKHEPVIADVRRRRTEETAKLQEQYATRRSQIDHTREDQSSAAAESKRRAVADASARYEESLSAANQAASDAKLLAEQRFAVQQETLTSEWNDGTERVMRSAGDLWTEVTQTFRPWSDPAWHTWQPPLTHASHLAVGTFDLDPAALESAPASASTDRVPLPPLSPLQLPASLAIPDQCSILLKYAGVEDGGRAASLRALQASMIRILTSLPPGKARFIIFDPVGLGENFAGFMHLADHDDALVGGKIWTEARHVEQRLTDLTEHMENVIQKYLRNEFRSITQYNEQAGEIAEPYRFLVIADFPAGFTEASLARLASVANSGARCGVHTLISLDARVPLPPGASLADIEKNSARLLWRRPPSLAPFPAPGAAPSPTAAATPAPGRILGSFSTPVSSAAPASSPAADSAAVLPPRFVWDDPELAPVPLTLDDPPPDELFTRLIHDIGAAAKRSSRVQVPFATIAPDNPEFWSMDSSEELRVPLGRAGATKLQYLTLGRGTSQHALIAGKTGSGKSTLLNAIVTNLSMWYSPDQVQFYLIDFKKGVEFKSYATHELAHARAVAIESDREFGLSVLQRLDHELKRRGNLFRDLGVQDLRGFRSRQPDVPMPRLLLIIDEFQEFFTEDDKLAQDAGLLLDRLVRQGRAFGMHVILGSQTLSGAFSLARSTMGQMGVRIALQCSEADSYVILSEDNAAARLLSRPGEAIYNDASGLIEGNSPFQIAWLPDEQREEYLSRVADLARERRYRVTERQAVFEGNVPADLSRNLPLMLLLETAEANRQAAAPGGADLRAVSPSTADLRAASLASPSSPAALKVWLGDAIAIKDPTAAVFRRQAGSNVVIVGQRDDTAAALFAAAMIGLSAQLPPISLLTPSSDTGPQDPSTQDHFSFPTFTLLDPTPPDSSLFGSLDSIAATLPRGHTARSITMKAVPDALADLVAELHRRQDDTTNSRPVFLLINGIQKYRALRRPEDDFSFGSSDDGKPPSPDKLLQELLREGPGVGIHVIIWCDTAPNLTRALEVAQGLREFDYRVLMQMSQIDSTTLIDSPDAGKLGVHRALLHSEEQGYSEKFRPYAMVRDGWLRR